jgi:hypothetical protein
MKPVDDPTITSKDMTVIIPTVAENLQQLKETVSVRAWWKPRLPSLNCYKTRCFMFEKW